MGGDGRFVRRGCAEFGYKTDVIPLLSFGSVKKHVSFEAGSTNIQGSG